MTTKKKNADGYFGEIIHLIQELKRKYPNYTIGQHISQALYEYSNLWGMTDKEFLFALQKYKIELESNIISDEDVDKIVSDAQDLNKFLEVDDGSEED